MSHIQQKKKEKKPAKIIHPADYSCVGFNKDFKGATVNMFKELKKSYLKSKIKYG